MLIHPFPPPTWRSTQACICTHQVHPPTCITHCTAARLGTATDDPHHDPRLLDLVVANSTALQVYSVRCAH